MSDQMHGAEKDVLPCCRGEGPCQAPPDIGPCDPLPTADYDAALVEQVAEALRTSRLSWGTHSDHWGDMDWQREFWTEAATIALTTARVIPPGGPDA